jgi:histidyl-tRNA synthetase
MLLLLSQEEDEQILASQAPAMTSKFLKKDSKAHYAKFKEYLDLLEIPYTEDHTLVGRFSYNTHTIWDFRHNETNEQIALGARHNSLSTSLGTPKEIPATGFFANPYIIINMLKDKNTKLKNKDKIDLYFVQL